MARAWAPRAWAPTLLAPQQLRDRRDRHLGGRAVDLAAELVVRQQQLRDAGAQLLVARARAPDARQLEGDAVRQLVLGRKPRRALHVRPGLAYELQVALRRAAALGLLQVRLALDLDLIGEAERAHRELAAIVPEERRLELRVAEADAAELRVRRVLREGAREVGEGRRRLVELLRVRRGLLQQIERRAEARPELREALAHRRVADQRGLDGLELLGAAALDRLHHLRAELGVVHHLARCLHGLRVIHHPRQVGGRLRVAGQLRHLVDVDAASQPERRRDCVARRAAADRNGSEREQSALRHRRRLRRRTRRSATRDTI